MSTVLLDSSELRDMKSAMSNLFAVEDGQYVDTDPKIPGPPGLITPPSDIDNSLLPLPVTEDQVPLLQAIPNLFAKVTLSMMSSPALQ